jgi:hypothetical protein
MLKRFIVSPTQGGQGVWRIQVENSDQSIDTADNQEGAVRKGEEIAKRENGVLVIQDENGRVEETRSF